MGEEKAMNPRLSKPKSDFVEIMKNLNLPYPKQIGTFVYGGGQIYIIEQPFIGIIVLSCC